jgi:hypothetical protein
VRPIKVAREMAVQTSSMSNKLITRVRFFVHNSRNNQRWREKQNYFLDKHIQIKHSDYSNLYIATKLSMARPE